MPARRPVAAAVVAALIWGTSFPAMAVTLGPGVDADPFLLSALRMGLAGLLAVGVLAFRGRLSLALFRNRWVWFLGGTNALGFTLQHIGVSLNESSATTALLVNTNLVFVAVLAVPLLGERLGSRKVAAVAAALFGLVALTTGFDPARLAKDSFVGDLFVFAAGGVWTLFILGTKRATRELPPLDLSAAGLGVTALLLAPTALLGDPAAFPPNALLGALYLGLVVTFPPLLLYTYSMGRLPATMVSVLTFTEVLFAAVLGVLLLDEAFGPITLLGGAFVLAAILLVAGEPTTSVSRTAPSRTGPGP